MERKKQADTWATYAFILYILQIVLWPVKSLCKSTTTFNLF